jgi:hypothetical protein
VVGAWRIAGGRGSTSGERDHQKALHE